MDTQTLTQNLNHALATRLQAIEFLKQHRQLCPEKIRRKINGGWITEVSIMQLALAVQHVIQELAKQTSLKKA